MSDGIGGLTQRSLVLTEPTAMLGAEMPAGTRIIVDTRGRPVMCMPSRAIVVAGVPCAASSIVHFEPDGTIVQATLGDDHEVCGVPLSRGSVVFWQDDGTFAANLRAPLERDGQLLPEGSYVDFEADGALKEWTYTPEEPVEVDGIPCASTAPITFFASGRLSRATLTRQIERDGITLEAKTTVSFYEDGRLERGVLGAPMQVCALTLHSGTAIYLSKEGRLESAQLVYAVELGGQSFEPGTILLFDAAGCLDGWAQFGVHSGS